jgi:hypothetical protein
MTNFAASPKNNNPGRENATMRFILTKPIHLSTTTSIPAGATGAISRYDEHHLQLTFNDHHEALCGWGNKLILDQHDTDQEIWDAIGTITLGPLSFVRPRFDEGEIACQKLMEPRAIRCVT